VGNIGYNEKEIKMNTSFVLVGKPYNPDLKKITKSIEFEDVIANQKLNDVEFRKAKQTFGFAVISGILYGAVVILSRRS
jgi:hypothetical protein